MCEAKLSIYWQKFINNFPAYKDHFYKDAYYFCDNEIDANECAHLVLQGIKRATASSYWWHEQHNEPLPKVDDINIVTTWSGDPVAIIQTTQVDLVPYNQISAEFAATEGEGDGSLTYWKRVHWDFYSREMQPSGIRPTEDMIIVCERFEKIFG